MGSGPEPDPSQGCEPLLEALASPIPVDTWGASAPAPQRQGLRAFWIGGIVALLQSRCPDLFICVCPLPPRDIQGLKYTLLSHRLGESLHD